jgi:transcription initiation factor TFIIE subunit beta
MANMGSNVPDKLVAISTRSREMTHDAIKRLKEFFPKEIPSNDLVTFLMPITAEAELVRFFLLTIRQNRVVTWDSEADTYIFKPPYEISSAEQLLVYFQKQEIAKSIAITDLQQGWKDCIPTINALDREHKLVVLRHKKDNSPRTIWGNDPTLYAPLDAIYVQKWKAINLPGENEIRDKLKAMSSRAAGDAPKAVLDNKPKQKKKVRRGHKITNTHMQFLDSKR